MLVATSTFWQGIDVPGRVAVAARDRQAAVLGSGRAAGRGALRADRRARRATGSASTRSPTAVLQLRQGFGRLIRVARRTRGVIAILDPRVRSQSYGRAFLESLPPCPVTSDRAAVADFFGAGALTSRLIPSPAVAKKAAHPASAAESPGAEAAPRAAPGPRRRPHGGRSCTASPAPARSPSRSSLIVLVAGGKSSSAKVAAGASDPKVKQAMLAAGCTFVSKPVLPPKHGNFHADVAEHHDEGQVEHVPALGRRPLRRAGRSGASTPTPVTPQQAVHNLEHGGVVIWWGPKVPARRSPAARRSTTRARTGCSARRSRASADKVAVTRLGGDPVALLQERLLRHRQALAICPSFNEKAFAAFRDAYRGHGPEGVPLRRTAGTGPRLR